MHDNKVRLSADVLEKAQQIADEWGLKNTRAAVEAVFRRYADEYRFGRDSALDKRPEKSFAGLRAATSGWGASSDSDAMIGMGASCEALDALDDLLGAS